MERWRPAGSWAGLHFAAKKTTNGTTATQIKNSVIRAYLR
jgi:hypothetical protein